MTKPTKAAAQSPDSAEPQTSTPKGKIGHIITMLRRSEGARIDELQTATGWQAHSVRGALAGTIKKKLGLTLTSEKTSEGRVYRIIDGADA